MSFPAFADLVSQFDIHPVRARGRVCGAVLVLGKDVHACVMPWARGRWFGRAEAALLNQVIDTHGEATTSATTEQGREFVERLGFIKDGNIYRSSKKWVSKA